MRSVEVGVSLTSHPCRASPVIKRHESQATTSDRRVDVGALTDSQPPQTQWTDWAARVAQTLTQVISSAPRAAMLWGMRSPHEGMAFSTFSTKTPPVGSLRGT